jgi:uncharacterized protein
MSPTATINRLKTLEADLRAKGVSALYLFGSVARGEATSESDIDLSFEITPGFKFSLFDQARIMTELGEKLGVKVDFVPRNEIHPYIRSRVESEQIKVFG